MFTKNPVNNQDIASNLRRLESESRSPNPDLVHFTVLRIAPSRPRDGDVAFADGTNWNPGAGAGLYEYNGGAWVKL